MILDALRKIFNKRPAPDSDLKKYYRQTVNDAILYRTRIVLIVGSFIFLSVTVLDRIMYPAYANSFLIVRIITAFLYWAMFALTFLKPVQNHIIWLVDAAILIIGSAINCIIYISVGVESTYYEGMNHVFLGLLLMNTFYIRHTVVTGLLIVLGYVLAILGNSTTVPQFWQIAGNKIILMNLTLFMLCLMTQIYKTQHFREFLKSEELRQTVEELNEANRKLLETEKMKDEFFATVSHELRTPLTLTLAPAESLLSEETGPLPEPQKKLVQTIHNNAIRLLQMVSGLLDFSRLEAGQLQATREPVEIIAATRAALDDFAPLFRQKDLIMELVSDPASAWILIDRYLYDRILFNLVSNAVKFTPPGGKINIALTVKNERLNLNVSDTGIGITEENIPLLFQKFRQLESSSTRRFEGTGLGLALVKEFAGVLDGDVSVRSNPGRGSTFSVECAAPASSVLVMPAKELQKPLRKLVPQFSAAVALPSAPTPSFGKKDLPRVLIAEDNLEMATYIKNLLQDFCQCQVVADGEEALETIQKWLPDLILADVMMPKKDGIALCKEVKANPATLKIPVVLLTALTHREAMLRGWEAGADEYLFKPFHPKELSIRVRSLLSSIATRQDADQIILEKNMAASRAKAELEQLQLFAFAATHDLQEPLRNIMLQTDALEKQSVDLHLNQEILQRLGRLRTSAVRMSKMIEQLRIFENVRAAAAPFQKVNLNKILQNVILDLEPRIEKSGAKIHVEALPTLEGDEAQLHRLFQNLIGNAIKFASTKQPPQILVRASPSNGKYSEISVEDNGIGFDEKYADLIFKPFQRLHNQAEYEGTGMGLSICQKIALRHGGNISVKSNVGQGTTFTIRLPYQAEDLLTAPLHSNRLS